MILEIELARLVVCGTTRMNRMARKGQQFEVATIQCSDDRRMQDEIGLLRDTKIVG